MENKENLQCLLEKENPQFSQDGEWVYNLMKKKYGTDSLTALDNILNGLCSALKIFVNENFEEDGSKYMGKVIDKILTKKS